MNAKFIWVRACNLLCIRRGVYLQPGVQTLAALSGDSGRHGAMLFLADILQLPVERLQVTETMVLEVGCRQPCIWIFVIPSNSCNSVGNVKDV
ncbi:hypothetical protein [Gynuella sunshinyii]|nr:hypothetical protein [Gynuella sunshinyii]